MVRDQDYLLGLDTLSGFALKDYFVFLSSGILTIFSKRNTHTKTKNQRRFLVFKYWYFVLRPCVNSFTFLKKSLCGFLF